MGGEAQVSNVVDFFPYRVVPGGPTSLDCTDGRLALPAEETFTRMPKRLTLFSGEMLSQTI